jgi:hypothetical protein
VYHMELGLCCGLQRIAHLVDGSSSHPHDALSERDPLPRSAMPKNVGGICGTGRPFMPWPQILSPRRRGRRANHSRPVALTEASR